MNKPRYRKIGASFFMDEQVMLLPSTEKLVALYLLVGQVNRIGLYPISLAKAQEELHLSRKVFQHSFKRVLDVLGWRYDPDSRVMFIPTWWKFNQPENPNVLAGALRDLDGLPRTELLNDFKANLQNLPNNLHQTFAECLAERLPIQYQEQEQKQKQEQDTPPLVPQGGPVEVPPLLVDFIREWNKIPGVKEFVGPPGKALIRTFTRRMQDHPSPSFWKDLLKIVEETSFLTGYNEKDWRADLPWILKEANLEKVISGSY